VVLLASSLFRIPVPRAAAAWAGAAELAWQVAGHAWAFGVLLAAFAWLAATVNATVQSASAKAYANAARISAIEPLALGALPASGGTLTGNLDITGTLTVAGNLTAQATLGVDGNLFVDGTSALSEAVSCGATLSATGAISANAALGVSGNLFVDGTCQLDGVVTTEAALGVNGNINYTGTLNHT
jgi:hypothetical protein